MTLTRAFICRTAAGLLLLAAWISGCTPPATPRTAATQATGSGPVSPRELLLDFEKPDSSVTWVPALTEPLIPPATTPATTQSETTPATTPAATTATASRPTTAPSPLRRIAQRPEAGLWSMSVPVTQPGDLLWTPTKPVDLGSDEILLLQFAHLDTPARNGDCTAQITLTDTDGKVAKGDAFPIKSKWSPVRFDLKKAFDAGLDISRIATIAVTLKPTHEIAADNPLIVQTDTWSAATESRVYQGTPAGPDKSFYVQSRADRIRIGSVGQYEMYLWNRAGRSGESWLEVFGPGHERRALGQEGTGLMLLDQSGFDSLNGQRHQTAESAAGAMMKPLETIPDGGWPANISNGLSTLAWNVVWTSPVGAIIEGRQEIGPYDRLGEPALTVKWRLMVYQWGQVFIDAAWTKTGEGTITQPVSWALSVDPSARAESLVGDATSAQRLLAEIYTPRFRQGMTTALPDQMQIDCPIAMVARTTPQKNTWWWAADEHHHIFGAGIPGISAAAATGESSCMLLVNSPSALTKAGSFGQYLDPPKIVMRQGELELTYPGDSDNDGFVESYGCQAIRLANGRATFTIYPQERPIFYPAFLFTVPAAERDTVDLKHSRLLINVDGKQFADPPVFPSGSFLLQLPYVLDRPVSVEAVLVKK